MATQPKSGYSLWLSPTSTEPLFTDLILSLSQRSSPATIPFSPHATLYADSLIPPNYTLDQIVTATREAVSTLPSSLDSRIICSFDKVEAGNLFFQCVYIKLQKAESEGLLELHRALRKSFGDDKDPMGETYFPHMSLVYGDLEMQAKEAIISGMREKAEITNLDASEGVQPRDSVLGETQFETNEILVVKTAGSSDEWEIAARVPLGKRGLKHEDF